MKRVLAIVVLCFFYLSAFSSTSFAATVTEREKLKALEQQLDVLGDSGQVSGSFLFSRKGKVIFKKTIGKVHPNRADKLLTHSAFNLGSVSKQFTAMAIMLLHHQGKLNYDERVSHYLPKFPYKNVTIRHLLTHTSGMVDYEELTDKYWDERDFTNQDMMVLFAKHAPSLEFSPGSQFEYSNTGYVVLAHLVENISKQSLEAFSKQYIFQPLHMENTRIFTVLSKNQDFKNRVYGQFKDELEDLYHLEGVTGDGAVYSTVDDLLKWHNGLRDHQLLPETLQREAFSPTVLNDGSLSHYGFGWSIDDESPFIVAHSGNWVGFRAYIHRNMSEDEVLIFMTNQSGGLGFDELRTLLYSALDTELSYIY
ncbi:beta-lactamase family protein [Pseudoalteromonas sp. JBTF-M23]|uniref:Beta-lactamase family protein n=1 Tax=Pseudoalteromonas caenipelagi TaxID=2726988 RepID=A0A849V8X4_9GAMM|nr:serine hydrolase domain-containing protein [Pseudoalteromonas caenipelagi]NOU49782.1 beta-lactamase family protein [Pseudoalteromonas caenipelagi]